MNSETEVAITPNDNLEASSNVESAPPEAPPAMTSGSLTMRLPFSFAKRYGVLIDSQPGHVNLLHKEGLNAQALMEVQRYLSRPYQLSVVTDDEFDRRLGLAYQSDSSEAMDMVEGLGDDMDLASLADSVPETEDLLEQ